MDPSPLLSTFAIIAMAELGDKTQLTVMTLCAKHDPKIIFLSSFLALLGIGGASIFIGSTITSFLPTYWISLGSGLAFIIFGIHNFLDEEETSFSCNETAFLAFFSLIALMELGDKTQLVTIVLAARFASPLLVFLGIGLAFLVITGAGVLMGTVLRERLSSKYIRIGSSIVFVSVGIIFIIGTITGVSIF